MSKRDTETLERRLDAVERAVAEGDHVEPGPVGVSPDEQLDGRLDALESRVDELDAALQAVRGFLGGVDAVNEHVEARAESAVAAVERLERRLDGDSPDADAARPGRTNQREKAVSEPDEAEQPPETGDRSLGDRLRDRW